MPHNTWPYATPPYTANTHIQDRHTLVDHLSIYSGVARDISKIMYNINTTNLFASGWLNPVTSGWFQNLDTKELAVENLHTRSLYVYNIDSRDVNEDVGSIHRLQFYDNKDLFFNNCAISGQAMLVDGGFTTASNLTLNSSRFVFNGTTISGGLYPYLLRSSDSSTVTGMELSRSLVISNGSLYLPDSNSRILVDKLSSFTIEASINESEINWKSYGGHDHSKSKIAGSNIQDSDILYDNDIAVNTNDASINVISGQITADIYDLHYGTERGSKFVELQGTEDANYKSEDLGMYAMETYDDKLYAAPSSGFYIYETEDLINWTQIGISGMVSGAVGDLPSATYIKGLNNYQDDLWILGQQIDGPLDVPRSVVLQKLSDSESVDDRAVYDHIAGAGHDLDGSHGATYNLYASTYGSDVVDGKLFFYGELFGYLSISQRQDGYGWDRVKCVEGQLTETGASQVWGDVSTVIKHNKPYLMRHVSGYLFEHFMDGVNGVSNSLYSSNDSVYDGLFGNGFNQVTSIIGTRGRFSGTSRRIRSSLDGVYHYDEIDNIDNSNSIVVFGNSYVTITDYPDSNTFAGFASVMINLPLIDTTSGLHPYYGSVSFTDGNPLVTHVPKDITQNYTEDHNLTTWLYSGAYHISYNDDIYVTMNKSINYGFLNAPFCGEGYLHYKHDEDTLPTRISYDELSSSGILMDYKVDGVPKLSFYERTIKTGFWQTKTHDWYYDSNGAANTPDPGPLPKTEYYKEPSSPISHDGVIYVILKKDTGFMYIGGNGPEHIDDGVMYTDMIKFQGEIYAVGNYITENRRTKEYKYSFVINKIEGRSSQREGVQSSNPITTTESRMIIYRDKLYVGIGNGRFLVKRPTHKLLTYGKRK